AQSPTPGMSSDTPPSGQSSPPLCKIAWLPSYCLYEQRPRWGGPRSSPRRTQPFEVGFDHHGHKLFQRGRGLPTESGLGLDGVAQQDVDFGRPVKGRIDVHVILVIQAHMTERQFAEAAYAGGAASGDHVVVGGGL